MYSRPMIELYLYFDITRNFVLFANPIIVLRFVT